MKVFFQFRNEIPYNLRQTCQIHISPVRAVCSGTEGTKFFGPNIFELVPDKTKELQSLWE